MDWRAISRSRSRISTMDWRSTSRSRSRPPPPGQPFDQGNLSNSWSEGKFAFPAFGELTPLASNVGGGMSRSLDGSLIGPNEHATSSSIPIPGIASQLRYGSPPLSSSLHSHTTHLAAVYEESAGLAGPQLMPYANAAQSGPSRLSHTALFQHQTAPNSVQPTSLPASLSFHPQNRHRADASSTSDNQQGNLSRQLRKTSFDHSAVRTNSLVSPISKAHDSANGQSDPYDPILVCSFVFRMIINIS